MELERLTMRNFRQFRDATIEFSQDPDRNVTVIHGQNGSGKTTVLNAFLWVFYDMMQSINRPDRVANQGEMVNADVGDTVPVEVEVVFHHEGSRHEVRRRKEYLKQRADDLEGMVDSESFTVEYLADAGHVEEPSNPDTYVRQIIPKDLSGLFFFDGEYINTLSGVDNQDEIQSAIRQMMGLTIMERSIKHLEWVEGQFRNELQNHGSDELQSLIEERNELNEEREELQEELDQTKRNRDRLQKEIEEIKSLLQEVGETRKLQEDRQELKADREELETDVAELNEELEALVSEKGFLTFAMPAIRDTAADLDELRARGEIPSELDNQFVDDLIEEGECICGRPLPDGSPEAGAVATYKSDVGGEGVDEASIRLIDKLDRIRQDHEEFFEDVDELLERRAALTAEIEELTGQIDDISTEISDLGEDVGDLDTGGISLDEIDLDVVESVSDLEAAKNAKEETVTEELKEDIVLLEREIEELGEEIEDLEQEIDDAEDEQREADLARKRMQTAKAVREELEGYYDRFQQTIRERADTRIDETFDQVATKNYDAVITDDFKLQIQDSQHGTPIEVDKSRGERQIASLSFIGSLVDIARDQYESDRDTEYFDGGIYPIVMDSPFGSLDKDHRAEVSSILPTLAHQVVVFVTDAQWEGPVQQNMGPSVGAHYRLDYDEQGGVANTPITQVSEQARTDVEVAD